MSRAWTVRIGLQAEQDYVEILRWTRISFGEVQARTYAESISLAIRALRDGPDTLGSKARDEIGRGIRTLQDMSPANERSP